jgi:hypothetical protein
MNIPDHISESLETIFWVKKYLNFLMRIRNLFDPGSEMGKFGSRINIPDSATLELGFVKMSIVISDTIKRPPDFDFI